MSKNPSIIQINGRNYNAATGQLIGPGKKKSGHLSSTSQGAVIDGFIRKSPAPAFKKAVSKITPVKPKLASAKKHLSYPAHTIHRGTQRSKTLMRAVVDHPKLPKTTARKAKHVKTRSYGVSSARMSKAMNVSKNTAVRHFMRPSTSRPGITNTASGTKPILDGEVTGLNAASTTAAVAIQPVPNMISRVPHEKLERMLDEALFRADAHKKALAGRLSTERNVWRRIMQLPTWLVVGLTTLTIIIVATLFAWKTFPQLSTKVASIRTHVSASVPGYKPEGFAMSGPAKATGGAVTMRYKAIGDSSKFYTVKEETSNVNSTTLMASSSSSKQQIQTAQANGVQIIMQGAKAQCASGGMLTTVTAGESNLSPDEILNIAKGICN